MRNLILSLWYRYKEWNYERKCIKYFGAKPERIVLSQENFDSFLKRLEEPSKPEEIENLKKLMSRTPPWSEE
jgi:hypothetical protein